MSSKHTIADEVQFPRYDIKKNVTVKILHNWYCEQLYLLPVSLKQTCPKSYSYQSQQVILPYESSLQKAEHHSIQ